MSCPVTLLLVHENLMCVSTVGWFFFPFNFSLQQSDFSGKFGKLFLHFQLGGTVLAPLFAYTTKPFHGDMVYLLLSPLQGASLQFKVVNNLTKVTFLIFVYFPHRKHWRKGRGSSTVLTPSHRKAIMKGDYILLMKLYHRGSYYK